MKRSAILLGCCGALLLLPLPLWGDATNESLVDRGSSAQRIGRALAVIETLQDPSETSRLLEEYPDRASWTISVGITAGGEDDELADALSVFGLQLAGGTWAKPGNRVSPGAASPPYTTAEFRRRVKKCRERIEADPQDPDCYAELGRIYLRSGMAKPALSLLQKGARLVAPNATLELMRALAVEFSSGEAEGFEESSAILRKAAETFPESASAQLFLAFDNLETERVPHARAGFEKCLASEPSHLAVVAAHLGLLSVNWRAEDWETATEHLKAAEELYPATRALLETLEMAQQTPAPVTLLGGGPDHPDLERRKRQVIRILHGGERDQ
ncbi:MAG: hypothetical protein GY719_06280 [bacterium]|nr:hypothetical protein [bacterium]